MNECVVNVHIQAVYSEKGRLFFIQQQHFHYRIISVLDDTLGTQYIN